MNVFVVIMIGIFTFESFQYAHCLWYFYQSVLFPVFKISRGCVLSTFFFTSLNCVRLVFLQGSFCRCFNLEVTCSAVSAPQNCCDACPETCCTFGRKFHVLFPVTFGYRTLEKINQIFFPKLAWGQKIYEIFFLKLAKEKGLQKINQITLWESGDLKGANVAQM